MKKNNHQHLNLIGRKNILNYFLQKLYLKCKEDLEKKESLARKASVSWLVFRRGSVLVVFGARACWFGFAHPLVEIFMKKILRHTKTILKNFHVISSLFQDLL
jgi:hypothetical protein